MGTPVLGWRMIQRETVGAGSEAESLEVPINYGGDGRNSGAKGGRDEEKKTLGCSSGWRGDFLCWISAAPLLQYAHALSSSRSVFLSLLLPCPLPLVSRVCQPQ